MSAGRIALLVTGCFVALLSLASLAGGGLLVWEHTTQRDEDGYYTTRHETFLTQGYALRSDDLDLGTEGPDWLFEEGRLATIRLQGDSAEPGKQLFFGIGRGDDVERYLDGVDHDVVADVDVDPFDVRYERESGTRTPERPQDQTFWAASGVDRVEWEVDEGRWMAVVMNTDASRGIVAEVSIGAKSDLIIWIALILLALGLGLGALAALLIALAVRGAPVAAPAAAPGVPAVAGEYPVQVVGEVDPGVSRWLWLLKWLLLIPHLILLAFLWAAFFVVTVIAFFAILFTERYPRGLFGFNLGVMRWTWRVAWYGYAGLGTDRYPPFTLADADYPARLHVPYPERLSRGLVLVKWWLLAIPHYLVISFFVGPGWWYEQWHGPGLIVLLAFFAGVVLLVRNRYPESLYTLVLGMDRWVVRVVAYAALMRDEYPPFRIDR
ncbi:MAG TPA: DUF4389 domain-containing protein [Gaiellaceae bacterium]|nr:DUF4389 domain-containing protein [Gaiellaceae bacterium]HET8651548.1 DUF4389 domain-containing protein [Gaiellaceae bacterium]